MDRLFNLLPWRRRRLERDLDRELAYHLDRRLAELEHDGLSDTEARRRAALEFGGVTRISEEVRDTWTWRWLDHLSRDVRYATRALLRNTGFTMTAVLSLALGVGANAAIFSLVDQVLLRPLPVREADRLVHFAWRGNALSNSWGSGSLLSYPLCRDLEVLDQLFDGVFCRHPTTVNVSTGAEHQEVNAELVSGSFFSVLGVGPELGRLIDRADDAQPGAHPVVVLSHQYWANRLGARHDVVGRTLLVNNYPMTVIGVAPSSFPGVDQLSTPALWIPAAMKRQVTPEWDALLDRRAVWMHVFARLAPGVTVERAKTGLQSWFKAMLDADTRREGFPSVSAEHRRAFLASTLDVVASPRGVSNLRGVLERPLWVLLAGTALLGLLACLNVAGLLLARGAARRGELTIRLALGASRGRITTQLLLETALVTLAGVSLGLGVAPAVSQALVSFLSPSAQLGFELDRRVFLFLLLMTAVTAAISAVAPLVQVGRLPLIATLKDRSAIGGGVRLRKALVVGQMAFTVILLVGAGLFVKTLAHLYGNVGFPSERVVMFRVSPPAIGYTDADSRALVRELVGRLRDASGVEAVAVANTSLLMGGSFARVLTVEANGRVVTDGSVYGLRVTPGFFATLGVRLIVGRDFDGRDTRDARPGTPGFRSAIVNQSFARKYFGDRSPVGRRVGIGDQPTTPTNIEIIGVVDDFSYRSLRLKESEHIFFPFWDRQAEDGAFYLRVRGNPAAAFASIRATVRSLDPALPVSSLSTFGEQIDRALWNERMLATLSSAFGVVALLLSAIGLYGVMAFVVTQRTREIGVRLALGATRRRAIWFIIRGGVAMVGAGIAIALPVAWVLGRLVESQLFGVRVADGQTMVAAVGALAVVALAAAMIPAWRAASVSPTEALRFD